MSATKERNSSIDLLKFLFSIIVVLLHLGVNQNIYIIQGGHLAVEGFFMITGYFMMCSVKKSKEKNIGKDTLKFILHKYSSFSLALIFSTLIAYIVSLTTTPRTAVKAITGTFLLLGEIVPIQLTGLYTSTVIGVVWYLSAMMIALFVLYPIARICEKKFTHIICPLAIFLLYGSLAREFGKISVILNMLPNIPIYAGILRAVAGICAGCILYECVQATKNHKETLIGELLFSVVALASAGIWLIIMCFFPNSRMDFFAIPFIFVLLYCAFGRKTFITKRFSCDFTRHLNTASLLIYLNHYYLNSFVMKFMGHLPTPLRLIMYAVCIIIACAIVQILSNTTKKVWIKAKPVIKKHFVGEASE